MPRGRIDMNRRVSVNLWGRFERMLAQFGQSEKKGARLLFLYRMELAQSDERVNSCQKKTRPVILPALPKCLQLPPLVKFNPLGMFQGFLKNFLRGGGHGFIFQPQHQFVIQIETANIKVGRADIGGIADSDEFGMQDLRLIFINLHAGFQQTMIQAAGGKLGNEYIRFARQD